MGVINELIICNIVTPTKPPPSRGRTCKELFFMKISSRSVSLIVRLVSLGEPTKLDDLDGGEIE